MKYIPTEQTAGGYYLSLKVELQINLWLCTFYHFPIHLGYKEIYNKVGRQMILSFLGTGAGVPAKHRNVSALALKFLDKGNIWLFDCGEATQHQILYTPLKISKINKIFITHMHGDHIYGLPGLLGSRSFQGETSPLTIYGPTGLKEYIDISLSVSKTYLRYPLEVVEVYDGFEIIEENFKVVIGQLEHGIPSYGYRIEEQDMPGILMVDALKDLGISPGPIYSQLKSGQTVTLDDGRVICGKDFIGPAKPGRKLAILGDTRVTNTCIQLAENVDVLVHEATFQAGMEAEAKEFFHSTNVQAANIALKAKAKNLILNHISSRYQDQAVQELLEQAKEVFENTVLAKDFFEYHLKRS
jgi:ribonuclease Z